MSYPEGSVKGRGAVSNHPSRFLPAHTLVADDGWGRDPADEAPRLETTVLPDRTRQLITRNQSSDVPFDHSINPYKGCEHGCIYCFARPTHAFLDLSPGMDFETRLFFKTGVREHLTDELCRKGYVPTPMALGTNTDPYQPIERERRVTREILEVLLECRHPVTLVTKGAGVLRDVDLWSELARLGLAQVKVSITTLKHDLKNKLEPRTASPEARLKVLKTLHEAGVPVGVLAAPMIPFINDHELEDILAAARECGATHANYILLRLPLEVQALFMEWLDAHYPGQKERVLAAIRDTRGGALYQSGFGQRMRGTGPIAELLGNRFKIVICKLGLSRERTELLRQDLFRPPSPQGSLF
ncbi:MAG: PA0069 family radical SAM protein [Gammaproteobacteria bacterium]|nr:PA0069 family radical SAM protein [Gammaproteobacteria bacterium]